MERWLPVAEWPDYEVSDHGRVRSWRPIGRPTTGGARADAPRVLSSTPAANGYPYVGLQSPAGRRVVAVHRLVLEAFVGAAPSPDHEAAHGDGNRSNNRLENLRWATRVENAADKHRHGTMARGELHGLARLTWEKVRGIRRDRSNGDSLSIVAARYGCSIRTVAHVEKGDTWRIPDEVTP